MPSEISGTREQMKHRYDPSVKEYLMYDDEPMKYVEDPSIRQVRRDPDYINKFTGLGRIIDVSV